MVNLLNATTLIIFTPTTKSFDDYHHERFQGALLRDGHDMQIDLSLPKIKCGAATFCIPALASVS